MNDKQLASTLMGTLAAGFLAASAGLYASGSHHPSPEVLGNLQKICSANGLHTAPGEIGTCVEHVQANLDRVSDLAAANMLVIGLLLATGTGLLIRDQKNRAPEGPGSDLA
jgi:hypothetical protein